MSTRAAARGTAPAPRAVDVGASLDLVGTLVKYLGFAAVVPAAVALGYGEPVLPFVGAGVIMIGLGVLLERTTGRKEYVGAREGFLVVALTWLFAALFAALPYLLSGEDQLGRPVDAYFEGMSGFTTTGATILTDIEALPKSLLLWRQFTQWLGGMGIIVLALAVLPRLRVGGRQLLESELPGPEVEPLTSRIRDTAQRLWILYIALTALEALILAVLGWTGVDDEMDVFNAVSHAFTTLPTGGFSPEARSIETFAAASQWVIWLFMLIGGVNFALSYRAIVRRQPRVFARDEEFRLYLGLLALATIVLGVDLWTNGVETGEAAIRHALFNATSVMTTTGYASSDFALWPTLALMAIVGLMFMGGSAGSTSGSVKVIRHLLLGKVLRRELDQTVHPELVKPVWANRRVVDERTLRAVTSFILLYIGIFVAGAVLLSIDAARVGLDLSVIEAVSVSASTLGNVGPALGLAGPMESYEPFSDLSTVLMTGLMWLGRLEVIPVVVLFTRHYWRI